jgi:hypothetical protein
VRGAASLSLLLAGALLAASDAPAATLQVERVELSVQLDPELHALYATARLFLRNPGRQALDVLDFTLPAPLGARFECRSVWERKGELGWRLDPADNAATLRVALASPLKAGKKLVVGISYEVDLENLSTPDAPASVSAQSAQLFATGWYPLPAAGSGLAVPGRIRLAVRLPKEWRVSAPVKLNKIAEGSALASYELEVRDVKPGQLLLSATAPP